MTHRFSGAAAAAYDAGRAPYVPAVVAALDLPPPPARIVDLAAGTGLLTRALLLAGHQVVAVEPDPEMALPQPPEAVRVSTTAEATGLPSGSADAVVAGDAWHWFEPDAAAAEAHRLLVPRGRLAVVWRWSIREERPPELGAFFALLDSALATARNEDPVLAHALAGERGLERVRAHPGFAPLVHRSVRFLHRTSRAGLLAEATSASYVNTMDRREALLDELATALEGVGPLDVAYRADIWLTRRRRD